MLSKPCNGWTDFMLEGAEVFGLRAILMILYLNG